MCVYKRSESDEIGDGGFVVERGEGTREVGAEKGCGLECRHFGPCRGQEGPIIHRTV